MKRISRSSWHYSLAAAKGVPPLKACDYWWLVVKRIESRARPFASVILSAAILAFGIAGGEVSIDSPGLFCVAVMGGIASWFVSIVAVVYHMLVEPKRVLRTLLFSVSGVLLIAGSVILHRSELLGGKGFRTGSLADAMIETVTVANCVWMVAAAGTVAFSGAAIWTYARTQMRKRCPEIEFVD